ncbi:MAG: alpha/beta hydrolase [Rikenellaceae bacterium]
MKRLLTLLLMVSTLIAGVAGAATPTTEDLKIPLWNNGDAPHSNRLEGAEGEPKLNRITNITQAELLIYKADPAKATGQAVVICPGGGYMLVSMDNEGTLLAEWFAKQGITAAVLKYRLPNGVKEVPFEDAELALKVMRQRSRQLGYSPDKVGICGASAGGHLAASVSVLAEKSVKPNFTVLFYPVISGEKGVAHEGSFNNLLGKDRTEAETLKYSLERSVDETTPPTIMLLSSDDKVVPSENSVRYYRELRKHNTLSALYIFPKGGHGWSMSPRVSPELWQPLLLSWLADVNKELNKELNKQLNKELNKQLNKELNKQLNKELNK